MVVEEKKYIHIEIEKYDILFDNWVEETNTYIDQFNLANIMNKFDTSCGLKHSEKVCEDVVDNNSYTFEVTNGQKFVISVIRYDLYNN